ncbi:hypothetical protein [Bradyrhizobium sp. STM 3809]|uniref:hypothetical protein n=1 Tax=Bradyrhizobium sp. STM 3809 TaxID=551936 RepID=UPI0002409753|nr:hypothetical protein [Bradyrhizobium sp. STM 3809]CCE00860.1 conserved exported hypothetical protein [Bradyrhizobium sp. STM 3809]
MVGRALNLATVAVVFCIGLAGAAMAQENLDAGKSPAQIYNGTCVVCHKSPRGLAKTVSAGSLPGFLRQHYTTSPEMAGVLANYLISNGAADARYMGHSGKDGSKDGKETRAERRARAAAESSEAKPAEAKPAAEGEGAGQSEPRRRSRHSKRTEPAEAKPDAGAEAKPQAAEPADGESGAAAKKGKHGKRKKPTQEGAATDERRGDATGTTTASPSRNDAAAQSEPPKVETPKSSDAAPALRADPVPPVTPAPATTQ